MSIREQLQVDLKDALKRGDKLRVSTIRLLNADLQNRAIATGKALDDTDVVDAVCWLQRNGVRPSCSLASMDEKI